MVVSLKEGSSAGVMSKSSDFAFRGDRLWAAIDNNTALVGLIDSGASVSVFPSSWPALGDVRGRSEVETPFGSEELVEHDIEPWGVGARKISTPVLVGSVSYPIIGNDLLFSSRNTLFSNREVKFDVEYDLADMTYCTEVLFSYSWLGSKRNVDAVNLMLEVDGRRQAVLFDTGRAPLLEAGAHAPLPREKLFPRPNVRFNSLGRKRFVSYYSRRASLSLGKVKQDLSYRHYFKDFSIDVPFVLGGGFLKEHSVLIDREHNRACFFSAADVRG